MTKIAKKEVLDNGLQISFSDDTALVADLDDFSVEIVTQLALHGLSQKIGDSYAGVKGNLDEAKKLAQGVYDRLKAGEFKASRAGDGGGRVTQLARALARVTGRDLAECVAMLEDRSKSERTELGKDPRIVAAKAAIQAEEAQAKLEAAGEMADLGL